jgi:hypothetical protein
VLHSQQCCTAAACACCSSVRQGCWRVLASRVGSMHVHAAAAAFHCRCTQCIGVSNPHVESLSRLRLLPFQQECQQSLSCLSHAAAHRALFCCCCCCCCCCLQISVRVTFDRGDVDAFVSEAIRLRQAGTSNYETIVAGAAPQLLLVLSLPHCRFTMCAATRRPAPAMLYANS